MPRPHKNPPLTPEQQLAKLTTTPKGHDRTLSLLNQSLRDRATAALLALHRSTPMMDLRWHGHRSTCPPIVKFEPLSRVVMAFPSWDRRSLSFHPRDSLGRDITWLHQGSVGTVLMSSATFTSQTVQFDEAPSGSPSLIDNRYLLPLKALHGPSPS